MARRVKDQNLESRDARLKLKARGKPHWRSIGRGLHLGYRKSKVGGMWVVRRYLGKQTYPLNTLAQADDMLDANGVEVLDFWQAQDAARNLRSIPALRVGGYTVADAVDAYLVCIEGKASHHDITKRMHAYVLPILGARPINALDPAELRKWHRDIAKMPARRRTGKGKVQAYRKADMSDPDVARQRKASANRILSHLKAALNHFRSEHPKDIPSDDAWRLAKLFENVDVSRAVYLKVAEAKRLINASQGDFRALVRAALETGARYSELGRLQVSDFNPDTGKLRVRKHKAGVDKYITLNDEGRNFFEQLAAGRPGSELLLGRAWGRNHQNAPLKEACARAGINPPIHFHALRHTWASLALMAGMDRMAVAKNLGHVDTRMIERHYGHLDDDYVTKQIRDMAPRFGTVATSNVKAIQ